MGLSERVEWLEDQVAELRSRAEWKEEARAEARRSGIPEDEMEKIWLRTIGPQPCTCAEHLGAILEATSKRKNVEFSD